MTDYINANNKNDPIYGLSNNYLSDLTIDGITYKNHLILYFQIY